MNRCLYCGLQIEDSIYLHKKCIREIFTTDYIPVLDLTQSDIISKARKMAGKLSISGVQPKLSAKLNRKSKELEITTEGGEFILKPQVETYQNLPQNENLCMTIASNFGIYVPPHTLIKLKDNTWAYLVRRFDRIKKEKIHQEDFFQILEKKDKYDGSFEEIGRKLKQISDIPGLDIQYFYERVLYFFIIGNGDAHMKNFSIVYKDNQVRLSPAYDIVCSKIYFPEEEDMAISMNGRKNKITRKDFDKFLNYLQIQNKKIIQDILKKERIIIEFIEDSQMESEQKSQMIRIVKERFLRLKDY